MTVGARDTRALQMVRDPHHICLFQDFRRE
jgi:hypothetical protein